MKQSLTKTEREFAMLYRSVDEKGKEVLADMLICTATFGDVFLAEMKSCVDQGRAEEIANVVREYKARLVALNTKA